MKITIFYDYICPFCYIGTKRILDLVDEMQLDVEWTGIEIHPEYSSEGKRRKSSPRLKHITQTLYDIAEQDGTDIKLPGFITNSRLCLESAEFAKTKGKFLEFHKTAYDSYMNKRENIGQLKILLSIGKKVGLDLKELEHCLRNREMKSKIDENKRIAEEKMVLGVPTIYFNEFRVHGVQSTEAYREIIKKHLLN